jgi:F0F1-type ATP synthase membrane subunit b/b'
MKQVSLGKIQFRLIIAFLVTITFWLNTALAQADTLTPEAKSYQTDSPAVVTKAKTESKNFFESAKEKLEEAKEDVVEKLNLNEPIPESTKEFLNDTEKTVEKTVEPITKTESGYYSDR